MHARAPRVLLRRSLAQRQGGDDRLPGLGGHVSCDRQGPGSGSCASDPCGREGAGQARGCGPRSWVALVAPDSTH